MTTHQPHPFGDLVLPYALGRLNAGQRRHFESHLRSGCVSCTEELAEITEGLGVLCLSLDSQSAPRRLRSRLLQIADGRSAPPKAIPTQKTSAPARPWFGYGIGFILLLIGIAGGLYIGSIHDLLSYKDDQVRDLREELEIREIMGEMMLSTNTKTITLTPREACQECTAITLWDTKSLRVIVAVSGLLPSTPDTVYHIWVTRNQQADSLGQLTVVPERRSAVQLLNSSESEGRIDSVFITMTVREGAGELTTKPIL
jgi:hypothetical protein